MTSELVKIPEMHAALAEMASIEEIDQARHALWKAKQDHSPAALAGDDRLGGIYSSIRRALATLDVDTPGVNEDQRRHIDEARRHLHGAEDAIGAAIRAGAISQ